MAIKLIEFILAGILITVSLLAHLAVAVTENIDDKLSAMQLSNWMFFVTLLYFCMYKG